MGKTNLSNIARARLAKGISQEEVARFIGVSRPTYIKLEKGEKELTIGQAEMLAAIFRVRIEDLLDSAHGITEFIDVMDMTEKYKQIILNSIYYGADEDGKITKTKLAKLVYLIDFICYYETTKPMSGAEYRKLPYGPVADIYFRLLDELEDNGSIVRELKGQATLFSLVEHKTSTGMLSTDEEDLIKRVGKAWRGKSTDDIVAFTHRQCPWQICNEGDVINYGMITQEEPEQIYGPVKIRC